MIAMLLALSALAAPPPSATWTIVAETDQGVMAMDEQSVVADGALRTVWTRASAIDEDGLAMTMVVLTEVDCADHSWIKRQFLMLDEKGEAQDVALDGEGREPVRPGTPSGIIFDKVCR